MKATLSVARAQRLTDKACSHYTKSRMKVLSVRLNRHGQFVVVVDQMLDDWGATLYPGLSQPDDADRIMTNVIRFLRKAVGAEVLVVTKD